MLAVSPGMASIKGSPGYIKQVWGWLQPFKARAFSTVQAGFQKEIRWVYKKTKDGAAMNRLSEPMQALPLQADVHGIEALHAFYQFEGNLIAFCDLIIQATYMRKVFLLGFGIYNKAKAF